MIDLSLERIVFVSPRSERDEVDDYVIFKLTNISSEEILLDYHLRHILTDANLNRPEQWADDLSSTSSLPKLHKKRNPDGGIDEFLIEARGILKSGQVRTIGLRTTRKGLVGETNKGISYSDPIRLDESNGSIFRQLSVHYTVIYPPKDEIQTYRISASRATRLTARSASWNISPALGEQSRVHAELCEDDLPIAGEVDACICKLLSSKVSAVLDLNYDCTAVIFDIIFILKGEKDIWDGISFTETIEVIESLLTISPLARNQQFDLALQSLYRLYRECIEAKGTIKQSASKEVLAAKKHIATLANSLRIINQISLPFPKRFAESLHHVLQFAYSTRRSGRIWSAKPNEKEFQTALHTYLLNNGAEPEREIPIGPGRMDILIMETPVEMKAAPLGSSPIAAASKYREQAAEYASRRGCCIGILLILDTEDRSGEKAYTPHLPQETAVDVVVSRPGVGGSSSTIVVTITITAMPPDPHSLKTSAGGRGSSRKRVSTK